MPQFSHLHVHSQYSLLDGAANLSTMFAKAVDNKMPGIALTDHGNMFGAFQFIAEAEKINNKHGKHIIKPVIGCEFYLVEDRHKRKFIGGEKDLRYHQLLLAKNATGYQNLIKLSSLGYIEGMYGKYPRIDKELILKYHEGLIATTCCLAAEVPRTILRKGEAEGEKVFKWWLDLFGEDYYVELQRHNIPDQETVNATLLRFAEKYKVKVIATNDTHYVEKDDYNAHDILLCVNTGEKQSTPTFKEYGDSDEEVSIKGKRFAFANDQFYFKKTEEMLDLFKDVPQAIDNTNEIIDKVEILKLSKDILLPNFPIPQEFAVHKTSTNTGLKEISSDSRNQWEYLKHISYLGAKIKYGEITPQIQDRLDFELKTIHDMGFAGYFLIVMDFIKAGRKMGVFIGPGRGSAAGSVVAYSIGIINVDPLKYDLLFERFLNPERIDMPDIDTDFDDVGRQKVIDYVVEKYGRNQVAQIVTFGSMAAKSSIKDVARVMDLDLSSSASLSKLVPGKPGIELGRMLTAPITKAEGEKIGKKSIEEKEELRNEDLEAVKKLREIYNYKGTEKNLQLQSLVLHEAEKLEGSIRNTGVHAAGIIIAPQDLTDLLPMAVSKDSDLWLTQFDGKIIEKAGVIKMDFLGLKNLTIIKDSLEMIERNHAQKIDIDKISFEDKAVFEMYQRGDTDGTFQFESPGMKKELINLKPDKFEDLIAMNALYRPGPMQYIPNYIARKQGRENVAYDLPEMEEVLKETYGVTVYQEQVMLLSQKIAGFSKGKADELRKAMGKKIKEKLVVLKPLFIEGGEKNGHPKKVLEKIWADWEEFAAYAFNKSHSTCYAYLAYQTAYLKVHYPAEYMAALLTSNLGALDTLTYYIDTCTRMGLKVLGPDVNESGLNFSVNKKGEIRFGLQALKGMGEAAADVLISERETNGAFVSIFDFVKRVNLRTMNKSSFEALIFSGAFDSFTEIHRAQFYYQEHSEDSSFLEKLIKFGNSFQLQTKSSQQSLFGEAGAIEVPNLTIPECEPWDKIFKLNREKIFAGFFISGHPLDDYRVDIDNFCNISIKKMKEDPKALSLRDLFIAGIISNVRHEVGKNGNPYGRFSVDDFEDTVNMSLYKENYLKYRHLLTNDTVVWIKFNYRLRYGSADEYEAQIVRMSLLENVMDEQARSLHVVLPVTQMEKEQTMQIMKIFIDNPGSCKLYFNLIEPNKNYRLEMVSSKRKVMISRVVKELKKYPEIKFTIKK